MAKDLFTGKSGIIISVIGVLVVISTWFIPVVTRNWLWTIFFFFYATLNILNYKNLKTKKNIIIAVGFTIAGVISLLNTTFVISISWLIIWLTGLVFIILANSIYKRKT